MNKPQVITSITFDGKQYFTKGDKLQIITSLDTYKGQLYSFNDLGITLVDTLSYISIYYPKILSIKLIEEE